MQVLAGLSFQTVLAADVLDVHAPVVEVAPGDGVGRGPAWDIGGGMLFSAAGHDMECTSFLVKIGVK